MAVRITRTNPRTGKIERPWQNRDGFFVLGNPESGAQKHHARFAKRVRTIEDVATLLGEGYSLRMTDGESPPSLISVKSLTIEEIEDADSASLWAKTTPEPPFTKEDMMAELQRAMLVQANQIAHAGDLSFAAAFMGFETENPTYPYCEDDPGKVDLRRFNATGYLDRAYDYAFQVGQYWRFGDDTAQDVREFILGANQQASTGDSSPLADHDSKCRRAADTAFGRWKLKEGSDLTVRELALLGFMTEAAVRNSLSKESIRITKGDIDNAVAFAWLKKRRDFIPTRTEEGHKERWTRDSRFLLDRHGFADAFMQILRGYPITAQELAAKAKVSLAFIEALAAGSPKPDLDALRLVGEALDLDGPHFAGVAVQAALRRACGVGDSADSLDVSGRGRPNG
ncbi:MAG: hypothetical protein JO264_07810 [Acidisphaera sp.]|nr:hypothetical protein [Acidisphaera sp.]